MVDMLGFVTFFDLVEHSNVKEFRKLNHDMLSKFRFINNQSKYLEMLKSNNNNIILQNQIFTDLITQQNIMMSNLQKNNKYLMKSATNTCIINSPEYDKLLYFDLEQDDYFK